MKNFQQYVLFLALLALMACSGEAEKTANGEATNAPTDEQIQKSLLPYSTGTTSTLYLYADQSFQESQLIDSLNFHLNQPYLLTPNLSPAVDITKYSFQTFESGGARTANNLMVVNMQEDSPLSRYAKSQLGQTQIAEALANNGITMIRVKDINASPQQLFYLLANGSPNLSSPTVQNALKEYAYTIIEESTKLDNQRLVSSFSNSRNYNLEQKVEEEFGIQMKIPATYAIVKEEDNFLWMIHETNDLYSNIVVYKTASAEEFSVEKQVIAIRDEFGEKITTNRENSRMTTHVSSKPLPITKEIEINDTRVIETRGLWEMVNDKLGGGFVNYAFAQADSVVVVDGFVFYAGDEKRRKMRDIDAIFSTIKLDETN